MKTELLQRDVNKIPEWSQSLEMEFNAKKYKVMEMGNILSYGKKKKRLGSNGSR